MSIFHVPYKPSHKPYHWEYSGKEMLVSVVYAAVLIICAFVFIIFFPPIMLW
jgi:hypothetical protein